MKRLLIGLTVGILLGSAITHVAAKMGISAQVVTCTSSSSYACILMPGTNSGAAVILVKADAGNPVLMLPTESGTLLTEERARQLFVALASPTTTPTPAPTPTATPLPTPVPTPTPNPVKIDKPTFAITEPFGVADTILTKFTVTAPQSWTASTSTSWIKLHCTTGACGGSFFYIQITSSGLARGSYSGTVTVTSGTASATLPVSLVVQ